MSAESLRPGGVDRFAAALAQVEAELPWERLGRAYCEGAAESFFDDERRAGVLDTGLRVAAELDAALAASGAELGSSLYVGAGVAELGPMLFESLVLGRRVRAFTLPGPEPEAIDRVLGRLGARLGASLPRLETAPLEGAGAGPVDHLWMVSVLTDPDAFPALHDRLYERVGTLRATGHGDLADERSRARRLVAAALDALRPPAVLSTTDEELGLLGPACAARGWTLAAPDAGLLTALVGDRLRICRVLA